MTDREALIACRQSVAFNLGHWQKWLRKDGNYSKGKTAAVKEEMRKLRALLDRIDEAAAQR